jgi:6-phosphogluconolactonase (cycloisomerase 2 family)
MQLASVVALLVVLAVRPAPGASILYATAATPGRIDAFCIDADGTLASQPAFSTNVGDNPELAQPRRLLVAGNVLYVAEVDRVEAFSIGERGGIAKIGNTRSVQGSRPIDLIVANGMLYVAEAGFARITAYPLDGQGVPAKEFTSCVMGGADLSYQRLALQNSLLYATSAGLPGRIEVHPVGAGGALPALGEEACTVPADRDPPSGTRPESTSPLSYRPKLDNPKAMVVNGDFLYVEERESKIILAFKLVGGLFDPPLPQGRKKKAQKPFAKSSAGPIYETMILHEESLLLTVFGKGRVDSFRLKSNGKIRQQPSSTSEEDVRMSPVGLIAPPGQRVVYVASGEHDRVLAYRLKKNGVLAQGTPFSETDEQPGSFPNDVAIAVLPGGCG